MRRLCRDFVLSASGPAPVLVDACTQTFMCNMLSQSHSADMLMEPRESQEEAVVGGSTHGSGIYSSNLHSIDPGAQSVKEEPLSLPNKALRA